VAKINKNRTDREKPIREARITMDWVQTETEKQERIYIVVQLQ
jgi:hypothetical protein